jgi:hypothetical protein
MLEFCPARVERRRWVQGKVSFNEVLDSFNTSLVKLCRMIFLHNTLTQPVWNDTLVKKGRGAPPLNRFFKF